MLLKQAQQRTRIGWIIGVCVVVAVALLLVVLRPWTRATLTTAPPQTGAAPAVESAADVETRVSEGGQVTIEVTRQEAPDGLAFSVVLDTHAVDLDGYDLAQLSVLRTADGQEVRPTGWDAPRGGHHRQGRLTFPATPTTGPVELVIRDIAGVPERSFQWP